MVDLDHWRCELCSFSGTFGAGDTIGKHVKENKEHVQAAIAAEAKLGKGPKQAGLREAWAKGVEKGSVLYPTSFAPGPGDIPFHKLREHIESQRCHGFFSDEIKIAGEIVHVGSLKQDLHPGDGWYADRNYQCITVREGLSLSVKGTFRHVPCEGFLCSKCPLIPTLPDFKKRALREMESEFKRGTRVCQKGVKLKNLQREELIESVKEWQSRCKLLSGQSYWLNISLARHLKSKV
jgi:hypothetical protein